MTSLQAYLNNKRVKRVLSIKPGEEGFSLIELVVVVAVLAILAAIAIPSFTSLNAEAQVAGAKTSLANLAKECAVKLVDANANNNNFNAATYSPSGYNAVVDVPNAGTCDSNDVYTLTANPTTLPTFIYNAGTGAKTCAAGAGGGSNALLGCTNNNW
tara:strand:- start:5277 stop:5747 length:471 start_codon:yes stop_codon:yes gene_type:complete